MDRTPLQYTHKSTGNVTVFAYLDARWIRSDICRHLQFVTNVFVQVCISSPSPLFFRHSVSLEVQVHAVMRLVNIETRYTIIPIMRYSLNSELYSRQFQGKAVLVWLSLGKFYKALDMLYRYV